MKMFRKDEGFTLVELMVVVLIIGILVAIAIPVFNAASNSAKARSCFSNQRVIEGAVQQWLANNPDNSVTDAAGTVETGNTNIPLVPAFIKERPQCKNTTDNYVLAGGNTTCPLGAPTTGHGKYTQ